MKKENIMKVKGLHKRFTSKGVTVKAVTDVSFNVKPGETSVSWVSPAAARPRWDAALSEPMTPQKARSSTAMRRTKGSRGKRHFANYSIVAKHLFVK
jgi:hypothetical protein